MQFFEVILLFLSIFAYISWIMNDRYTHLPIYAYNSLE